MRYTRTDGSCLICNRPSRHLHSADDVQAWLAAVNKSQAGHPAGRKLKRVETPER